jgi:fatty-acid O-methyltransferase
MLKKIKRKFANLLYEYAGKYALKKGLVKRFMNLGYKGSPFDLNPGDRNEQLNFQLYNVISTGIDLKDKSVLEIGCGRGGGCYFLKEYKKAGNVVGIDLSESNIKLARQLAGTEKITFMRERAEKINLPQQSFDGIMNLESSKMFLIFLNRVGFLCMPIYFCRLTCPG